MVKKNFVLAALPLMLYLYESDATLLNLSRNRHNQAKKEFTKMWFRLVPARLGAVPPAPMSLSWNNTNNLTPNNRNNTNSLIPNNRNNTGSLTPNNSYNINNLAPNNTYNTSNLSSNNTHHTSSLIPNNRTLSPNSTVQLSDTLNRPTVGWAADPKKFYTLIMENADINITDIDGSYLVHWLLVNIPGNDSSSGSEVIEYLPPVSFQYTEEWGLNTTIGSGQHRFLFLVYEQPGYYTPEENQTGCEPRILTSREFSHKQLAKKYQLKGPIAGNFIRSGYSGEPTNRAICELSGCVGYPYPTLFPGVNDGPECRPTTAEQLVADIEFSDYSGDNSTNYNLELFDYTGENSTSYDYNQHLGESDDYGDNSTKYGYNQDLVESDDLGNNSTRYDQDIEESDDYGDNSTTYGYRQYLEESDKPGDNLTSNDYSQDLVESDYSGNNSTSFGYSEDLEESDDPVLFSMTTMYEKMFESSLTTTKESLFNDYIDNEELFSDNTTNNAFLNNDTTNDITSQYELYDEESVMREDIQIDDARNSTRNESYLDDWMNRNYTDVKSLPYSLNYSDVNVDDGYINSGEEDQSDDFEWANENSLEILESQVEETNNDFRHQIETVTHQLRNRNAVVVEESNDSNQLEDPYYFLNNPKHPQGSSEAAKSKYRVDSSNSDQDVLGQTMNVSELFAGDTVVWDSDRTSINMGSVPNSDTNILLNTTEGEIRVVSVETDEYTPVTEHMWPDESDEEESVEVVYPAGTI